MTITAIISILRFLVTMIKFTSLSLTAYIYINLNSYAHTHAHYAQFMNIDKNIQNPFNNKSMKGYLGKMLDKKATTVIIARQTRYGVKVTIKRSKSRRL